MSGKTFEHTTDFPKAFALYEDYKHICHQPQPDEAAAKRALDDMMETINPIIEGTVSKIYATYDQSFKNYYPREDAINQVKTNLITKIKAGKLECNQDTIGPNIRTMIKSIFLDTIRYHMRRKVKHHEISPTPRAAPRHRFVKDKSVTPPSSYMSAEQYEMFQEMIENSGLGDVEKNCMSIYVDQLSRGNGTCSNAEIADIANYTEKKVHTAMTRAKTKIRHYIADHDTEWRLANAFAIEHWLREHGKTQESPSR